MFSFDIDVMILGATKLYTELNFHGKCLHHIFKGKCSMGFLINISNKTHIVRTNAMFPLHIHPHMAFDGELSGSYNQEEIKPLNLNRLNGSECVSFARSYAMGDLIQLAVFARRFKEHYKVKNVIIFTFPKLVYDLGCLFKDLHFINIEDLVNFKHIGTCFHLDGVLEKDHSTESKEHSLHRVEILCDIFNVPYDNFNWKSLERNINLGISNARKNIAIQIRGSGKVKTLPTDYMKEIIQKLSEKYTVYIMDQEYQKEFDGPNVFNTGGKLQVYQCVQLLKRMDACITMDSGALWLAHLANCPNITLLGPTSEYERISLHPSYPEKVKSIDLSAMVGCKPCYETLRQCGGKINCMKTFDNSVLIEKIKSKLTEILGV